MNKPKVSGATIPYQLRPHKAIERNLFITILKKLDRCLLINLIDYRYIGFGAAFLEDFKSLHFEFGIKYMDCIEYDEFAYSRQKFNNPYNFITLYNTSSTDYLSGSDLKQDKNQIIWLDFASPKQFARQLIDIELASEKMAAFDILKFTFNSSLSSFISSHHIGDKTTSPKQVIEFIKNHSTLKNYAPDQINASDVFNNFSSILRAMGIRAIKRGLGNSTRNLEFNHISSFIYADGQEMTTLTGIVTKGDKIEAIIKESGLELWEFYNKTLTSTELIPASRIEVPVMTIAERIEIDKQIPATNETTMAKKLQFVYGSSYDEHIGLIKGYCRFYKYLPYYSKVTY